MAGTAMERSVAAPTWKVWGIWTALFWGASGVFATLFFLGVLDFTTSTKASLYGISIWLNGWLLAFVAAKREPRTKPDLYHDLMVLWMVLVSYYFLFDNAIMLLLVYLVSLILFHVRW